MTVHLDTNVLLDVFSADETWAPWSAARLQENADQSMSCDSMVYAEASARFPSIRSFEQALIALRVSHRPTPTEALFLAAKAALSSKRRSRRSPRILPDFIIGAHAITAGATLITRDPAGFRSHFPDLELIAP